MYSVPNPDHSQHAIEIRNEVIDSGFCISGAIFVNEKGRLKFRFDKVEPEIAEYEEFKSAMAKFIYKLGIFEKISKSC
jgi:hypothetical protein